MVTAQEGNQSQAIGKSKGGWTTKILALTGALGNPVRFELLPGNRYDTVGVAALIEEIDFDGLIADKASIRPELSKHERTLRESHQALVDLAYLIFRFEPLAPGHLGQ